MSNSIVRRTVWTTAGVWAVLILAVMIQSILGVTVAGARPEASRLIIMMTLPFTVGMSVVAIGAAMASGGGGAAGGLPGGTTEMVKLHLELEGDVGEVVLVLRRIGGGDHAGGEVRDGPRPPQRRREQRLWILLRSGGQRQLLQRWRPAAGRRSWLPTSRRAWTSWPDG